MADASNGVRIGQIVGYAYDDWYNNQQPWFDKVAQSLDLGERWPLWLPVALGTGIAAYFAVTVEPPAWVAGLAIALALSVLLSAVLWPNLHGPASLGAVMLGGFALAQVHTSLSDPGMITSPLGPLALKGQVISIGHHPETTRVVLDDITVSSDFPDKPDVSRVRLSTRDRLPNIYPGQRVEIDGARLLPFPTPVAPRAAEFGRSAYFEGLAAIAVARGDDVQLVDADSSSGLRDQFEGARANIAERIRTVLEDESAAVAVTLMTGDRSALAPDVYEILRDAGLAHLLAISGLHVGLVAGLIFMVVRGSLVLIEPLALYWPIKKIAATAAIAAAFFYMVIVGATIPTQRAFVMTGLVLLAVILDRTALSMRLVAWAAVAVMLVSPHSVVSASFQMSFAAVICLIASYETLTRDGTRQAIAMGTGHLSRLGAYVLGILLTSVIATIATAPFAMYHFQHLATYGLISNVLAVPLTAFWIMPTGLMAYMAMPFSAEAPFLHAMGAGIDLLLDVARHAADWPRAAISAPALPASGLALAVLGGLWICLWRGPGRWVGIAGLVAAAVLAWTAPRSILFVGPDPRAAGILVTQNDLRVTSETRPFVADTWARLSQTSGPDSLQFKDDTPFNEQFARYRCDSAGCLLVLPGGMKASLARNPRGLHDDCYKVTVVVALYRHDSAGCLGPAKVIDSPALARNGAYAVVMTPWNATSIKRARDYHGDRPWSRWEDSR